MSEGTKITLRMLCEEIGVKRRAVQGYEKAGLVAPSGKNERGYLLYDDEAKERIRRIKLFQDLGFSIKEIVEIIYAPSNVLAENLEIKQRQLREKLSQINDLIEIADKLIKECNV